MLTYLHIIVWDGERRDNVVLNDHIEINKSRDNILTSEYTNLKYQVNEFSEEVENVENRIVHSSVVDTTTMSSNTMC